MHGSRQHYGFLTQICAVARESFRDSLLDHFYSLDKMTATLGVSCIGPLLCAADIVFLRFAHSDSFLHLQRNTGIHLKSGVPSGQWKSLPTKFPQNDKNATCSGNPLQNWLVHCRNTVKESGIQ